MRFMCPLRVRRCRRRHSMQLQPRRASSNWSRSHDWYAADETLRRGRPIAPPAGPALCTARHGDSSMALDTIEDAIAAIAAGELVVVVDDTDRENEGDLIMAAAKATPEQIAFMIRHTSGIICVPMPAARAAGAAPRPDGRQQYRPVPHRLHRLGRLQGRHDHRHRGAPSAPPPIRALAGGNARPPISSGPATSSR